MVHNFSTQPSASILRVAGELDVISVRDLGPTIGRIAEERPPNLQVDLSGLRLIDSKGVGALVTLFKAVRRYDGKMSVLGASEQPLAVLRLLKLDRVLMAQNHEARNV